MNSALKPRHLAALLMALALADVAAAQSVTMLEPGTLGGSASNAVSINDSQQA
jgi:hypothetical protein